MPDFRYCVLLVYQMSGGCRSHGNVVDVWLTATCQSMGGPSPTFPPHNGRCCRLRRHVWCCLSLRVRHGSVALSRLLDVQGGAGGGSAAACSLVTARLQNAVS